MATSLNMLMTVATYVMGAVMREVQEIRGDRADEIAAAGMSKAEIEAARDEHLQLLRASARAPHLLRMFEEGVDPDAAETREERFEFGLDCVLDGIATRLPASAG
jgi:hypothetical protein